MRFDAFVNFGGLVPISRLFRVRLSPFYFFLFFSFNLKMDFISDGVRNHFLRSSTIVIRFSIKLQRIINLVETVPVRWDLFGGRGGGNKKKTTSTFLKSSRWSHFYVLVTFYCRVERQFVILKTRECIENIKV